MDERVFAGICGLVTSDVVILQHKHDRHAHDAALNRAISAEVSRLPAKKKNMCADTKSL